MEENERNSINAPTQRSIDCISTPKNQLINIAEDSMTIATIDNINSLRAILSKSNFFQLNFFKLVNLFYIFCNYHRNQDYLFWTPHKLFGLFSWLHYNYLPKRSYACLQGSWTSFQEATFLPIWWIWATFYPAR